MMTKKMLAISAIALGLLGTSCSKDDEGPARADLSVNFTNLQPLENGFKYEGWLIVDGQPVSTGFLQNVTSNYSGTFSVVADDLEKATSFVLSIEPANDTDSGPSDTKILSGDFVGNAAQLNSVEVIGDLSTAEGRFTLGTPTDNNTNTDNDENGIWFEVAGAAGLKLPMLPAGWKYEGWVVFNDVPVSTFQFTKVDEADEFNSYSGTDAKPPFPGEDFLNNSIAPEGVMFPGDVRGKTVVVSVEPDPDDSKKPFSIKPLLLQGSTNNGTFIPDVNVTNSMTLNSASFPLGFATK